jgi:lycopene cyclase domain-containing protein
VSALAYLATLLASMAGIAALDARWRLVLWRDARRGAIALAAGLALFLVWDIAGIGLGIFLRGDERWSTGVELAPHLPIEEPVFLLFLCYLALVAVMGGRRLLQNRARAAHSRERAGAEERG